MLLLREDGAMTNHHSGPSAAKEICRILPVFVGLPSDEVTVKQDHPAVAGQKADTAEHDLLYRNISARLFKRAFDFISETTARGGGVLFVGTKRQAQEIVKEECRRAGMYFVTNRWLGGTLTNFRTIKGGLDRLRSIERMREDGTYEQLPKKETVQLEKERARLEKYIGGLKGMGTVPSAVFIIDPAQETIAVQEARKLRVPIVAITDTNCDPDLVDYVIPGNDDAIRSVRLITGAIADACVYGAARRREFQQARDRDSNQSDGRQGGGRPGSEAQIVYAPRGDRAPHGSN